jgi:hypothetical protein
MSSATPAINSALATLTASHGTLSDSAQIELTTGEDPRFVYTNPAQPTAFPSWLSFGLRFFKVTVPPGNTTTMFGAQMTSNPDDAPGFIRNVLRKITKAQFENLSQSEGGTKLEFLRTDNSGNLVFNFAVARVRLLGKSNTTAKTVRVFFRMFQAQNTGSSFNASASAGTYRFFSDGVLFGRKFLCSASQTTARATPSTSLCRSSPR